MKNSIFMVVAALCLPLLFAFSARTTLGDLDGASRAELIEEIHSLRAANADLAGDLDRVQRDLGLLHRFRTEAMAAIDSPSPNNMAYQRCLRNCTKAYYAAVAACGPREPLPNGIEVMNDCEVQALLDWFECIDGCR